MRADGFARREKQGVAFYACRALERLPDLCHGFSTRSGGVSASSGLLNLGDVPWDTGDCVAENRRRYLSAIGAGGTRLATLLQIHSDRIHIIDNNAARWNAQAEGDALISQSPGVALAVQTADCFPILIADPRTSAVAAVHSGWRGTLARILSKTVAAMAESCGCDPSSLLVAVGPGIRSCCFEVGPEVVELCRREFPDAALAVPLPHAPGKHLLDLPAALRRQALECGIEPARIFDLGLCSRCTPEDFFSYRRESHRAGRMMGVIARLR
jgi:hypothetical protein